MVSVIELQYLGRTILPTYQITFTWQKDHKTWRGGWLCDPMLLGNMLRLFMGILRRAIAITKLPPDEDDNTVKWYLPHFPVKKARSTTKVRIVFDAPARHNEIALNNVIFQGPKLQNNLFDALLRF